MGWKEFFLDWRKGLIVLIILFLTCFCIISSIHALTYTKISTFTTTTSPTSINNILSGSTCSGNLLLTLTPSIVTWPGNVIPSASGLLNCDGKIVYFKKESCLDPSSANVKAAYNFDENTGTITHDYSGNNNIGTIHGASWISGKFSSALYFDDINNYVDIGNSGSLDFGPGQDFSISAWIKSNDVSKPNEWGYTIVSIGWGQEDINGDGKYEKDRATLTIAGTNFGNYKIGKLLFFAYGQWEVWEDCMFPRIDDGKWHHVVAVADRDANASLYIDNILVGQTGMSSWNDIQYGLIGNDTIGATGSFELFNGIIDEVRVYNKALMPEDVSNLYNEHACIVGISGCTADAFTSPSNTGQYIYYACVDKNSDYKYDISEQSSGILTVSEASLSGIIGYWKLDEGSGTNIYDSSGNGRNGVIVNPSGTIWTKDCIHHDCLYFNGNGGYVDIPNQLQFQQITLESSIYPFDCGTLNKTDNLHSSSTPLTVGVGSVRNVYFEYRNDCSFEFNLYDSNGVWQSVSTILIPNLWYHVIGTFDGINQRLYVNGQLVASGTSNGMKLDNTNIRIGVNNPSSTTYEGNFSGKIDEVKIYNRALTPSEIPKYYNYSFIYPLDLPYDPESRTTLPIATKFEQKNLSPFYLKRSYDWPFGIWGVTSYYPIAKGTVSFDEEGLIFNSCGHMWMVARSDYLEQVNVLWVWKPLNGKQFITEAWVNKIATGSEKLAPGVSPNKGVGLTCMIFFEPTGIYYSKADETNGKVQLNTKDLTKSKDWIYVNAIVDYRDSVKKIKSLTITTTGFSQTWIDLPIGYEPTGDGVFFQPQVFLIDSGTVKVKQISVNQITTTINPQPTTIRRPLRGAGGSRWAIPLGIMSDSTFLVIDGIIVVIILVAIFGAFKFFAKKK
jgi:hypothetical protein